MRDINSMTMSRGHVLAQVVTHQNAQLVLPDKGRAIKGLVVCYVLQFGSMKWMGLRTYAKCVGLVP